MSDAAIEVIYTVSDRFNPESEGTYYVVIDRDGDEVADFETMRDAQVEADGRNVNAAIEDAIGGLETALCDLTESRRPEVLQALRHMIATAAKLAEAE